jgi:DNA-binding transcriptional ArsR family regulator
MSVERKARLEARARIAKALAHPARLLVVEELAHGERCVCELTAMIGSDMSTVSKHLSVLRNAGIIVDSKRGLQVYYSLKCPCILKFFECFETVIQANAKEHAALARG